MRPISYIVFFCLASLLHGIEKNAKSPPLLEKATIFQWKHFDGNRINASINSAGPYADYLEKNSSGLEWPKGSGKTAIFTAGIMLVGRHEPTDSLRTAVMQYSYEFQPGPILGTFNTATNDTIVAADPNDTKFRIYKINKGDNKENNIDYAEWPGELGAPFIDVNKNGLWDKGIDKPKLFGDQTLWCVFNDVNIRLHEWTGTTKPMGIEVQATYFGFNDEGPLGDVMFIKWIIINKSDALYDSTYFSLFSDIDLGDANDDEAGCDTVRDLGYVYNGDAYDDGASGYGTLPPSAGFTLLQGPLVPGSAHDIATFSGKNIQGFKNLRTNSHVVFLGGGGGVGWDFPPLGNLDFARQAYNAQKGLVCRTGTRFIDPTTSIPTPFVFSGDPVTNSGWNSNATIPRQDVRSMISSGPFTLSPGDTQEVIGAFVIAQGVDRLNSITKLRRTSDLARNMYSNQFRQPLAIRSRINISNNQAAINIHADGNGIGATLITAVLKYSSTNTIVATQQMKDDGSEGDSIANDKIFSASFDVLASMYPYQITFIAVDSVGNELVWEDWGRSLQCAQLVSEDIVIFSDHLNNNGIAEHGENIRFGIRLKNPNKFSLSKISISSGFPGMSGSSIIPHIQATTSKETSPADYFTMTIPNDTSIHSLSLKFILQDSVGNYWTLEHILDVRPLQKAQLARISGKGTFDFDVIIGDSTKLKNHLYVVTAIDSVIGFSNAAPFLVVKDSTIQVILSKVFRPDFSISGLHAIQPVDGFKVVPNKYIYAPFLSTFHSNGNQRWYDVNPSFDVTRTSSSMHYGDLTCVSLKFSSKTGFIDSDGNGVMDVNEKAIFDTTDTERTQKAYFYGQQSIFSANLSYLGLAHIPFAVYDADVSPPKKLTVVIIKRDSNAWMNYSLSLRGCYILSYPYQDDNLQFNDSSSGGYDLHKAVLTHDRLPYFYQLNVLQRTGKEILNDTGSTSITYSHPFSSRDLFVFNPTTLASVPGNKPLPTSYALEQNYPNPFNPITTIRYSLPKQSHASVVIYNILGQRVRTLLNEIRNAGTYEIDWDGRDDNGISLATGVYIYRFAADGSQMTKKMLLLK